LRSIREPPDSTSASPVRTTQAHDPRHRRTFFTALTDPAGVTAHRPGALERVQLLLTDWTLTHQRIAETETRMTGVLDDLGLTRLVTSIPGISPVGAAAIPRGGHGRTRGSRPRRRCRGPEGARVRGPATSVV
jgi:hypothetical protein